MKKIKVLQFPIANNLSGVTQYVLQNLKFIDKERFQFDFATRSKKLYFEDELIAQGCKVHHLSCSSEEDEEQFIKEINEILDEGYDAVHLHTSFWKGFLVEKIAIERNCPVVIIHSHSTNIASISDDRLRNEYMEKHKFYRDALPLEYGTSFCACSKQAGEWLFGEQIPRDRIMILKNATDLERYSFSYKKREEYREILKLNDCFVLGHIGRFVYEKNHEKLIEIFKEVYKKTKNARLLLIGTGELEVEIKQKVKEYGLEEVVLFLGKREDVPQLLQAIDVFLLPSRFEGLPLVLIEAQVAGLKCFASDNISLEVKVTPNLKFLSDSTSDWVENIVNVSNGYKRVKTDEYIIKKGYDLKTQIKLIEKLYLGEDISKYCSNLEDEI